MEKIDRNLIIVDMCSRIPYGTKVCYEHPKTYRDVTKELTYDINIYELVTRYHGRCYLRPISSMTEEERQELIKEFWGSHTISDSIEEVDWYLKRHFDIRGLIEKGLATEVTKDNNPYKD